MNPDPTCLVAVNNAATTTESDARPGILVVDDDTILLRMLDTVFRRQGFVVWTAADGRAAVDLYRRHHQAVALVLLDVCMPGMDGLQTLRELRGINPHVRACFMSGFSGKYVPEELHSAGGLRFVEKPFDVLPLAQQMWQLASGAA